MPQRKLGVAALKFSIFFCVSGGPYGLEPVIGSAGPQLGILLILLLPIFWAIPSALMSAELGTALPEDGGYIAWVERAMGPFAGFLCGWWSWLYAWVDVAIYPVLFAGYLEAALALTGHATSFSPLTRWLVGLGVIVPFTLLNLFGAKSSARAATVFAIGLLVPFVAFCFSGKPISPMSLNYTKAPEGFGAGLFAAMWNYLGWDTLSTVAPEVEKPQRTIPKAIAWSMLIIVACYIFPVLVALRANPNPEQWTEKAWPSLVTSIAGPSLGLIVAFFALASSAGQFNSMLLGTARVPSAMAHRGWLPQALGREHARWGTPVLSILLSSIIYSVLCLQTFKNLAVADVVLYSAALALELLALGILRKKEPNLTRPFKIPGGWPLLLLVILSPLALIIFACAYHFGGEELKESGNAGAWAIIIAVLSGPVFYALSRKAKMAWGNQDKS